MNYLNPLSITFIASFIAIIGMIVFKAMEIKRGKVFPLASITGKADPHLRRHYHRVRTFFSYFNRRSAIAFVQWIAYHILSWARSAYLWMRNKAHAHPPSKKVIDMVRGRGRTERTGGASFYLKNISKENSN